MGKDILVILMVAFGLFAILMFILFFIYLKKYYNNKHTDEDYKKNVDEKIEQDVIIEEQEYESEMDFVPIKKK